MSLLDVAPRQDPPRQSAHSYVHGLRSVQDTRSCREPFILGKILIFQPTEGQGQISSPDPKLCPRKWHLRWSSDLQLDIYPGVLMVEAL